MRCACELTPCAARAEGAEDDGDLGLPRGIKTIEELLEEVDGPALGLF